MKALFWILIIICAAFMINTADAVLVCLYPLMFVFPTLAAGIAAYSKEERV